MGLVVRGGRNYGGERGGGGGVVDHVVSLCVDSETGARNIDFVVNETILPLLSARVLERMAEGGRVPGMTLVVEGRGLELRFE